MKMAKDITIVLEQGFVWMIFCLGIPLLPAVIFWGYASLPNGTEFSLEVLIPSLTLFVFASIVVGIYAFIPIVEQYKLLSLGFLVFAVILGLSLVLFFTYYNVAPGVKEWINENPEYWRWLFSISIATVIILNFQEIMERINKYKHGERISGLKKLEGLSGRWGTKLGGK